MRRLSLNARLAQDAEFSDQVQTVLYCIEHEELAAPIRLSTDNTERVSTEPLIYGTRSSWRGANPVTEPYLWILASALVPSDMEDVPGGASMVLENLDREIARLLRSFRTPATIHMAVVYASTPDVIEAEYSDLEIVSSDIDPASVVISFSREEIEREYYPGAAMTRDRFPGLQL